jgi:hypothetical protein
MPVSESARYRLYEAARAELGDEPAETLMDLLPPVGWADVATKADLRHLGDTLRLEFRAGLTELRAEFKTELHESHGSLSRQMHDQTRTLFFTILASNATLVALAFAAARIAGG